MGLQVLGALLLLFLAAATHAVNVDPAGGIAQIEAPAEYANSLLVKVLTCCFGLPSDSWLTLACFVSRRPRGGVCNVALTYSHRNIG